MAHGSIRSALKGAAAGMALAAAAFTFPSLTDRAVAAYQLYDHARFALNHCASEGFTGVVLRADSDDWRCSYDLPGDDAYEAEGDAL